MLNNTERVDTQCADSTFRSVTGLATVQHNSCMDIDPVAIETGERIKRCRKLANWTQKQLSLETGWTPELPDGAQPDALSQSRIGNFEQGTRRVGIEEARILERVFHVPAPYFMGLLDPRETDVIAALRGLRGRASHFDNTGS